MKTGMLKICMTLTILAMFFGPVRTFAEEAIKVLSEQQTGLPPGEGTKVAEVEEDTDRPSVSADVSFLSQYIWRGYELSKDSLVIEPSVTASYKGFSINVWGNLDTDAYAGDNKGQSKWTETDFTVGYDHSFGPVGVGLGYIYYALDAARDTQEFYLSIGGDVILAPTLTIYRDVDEYPGWYLNLGISHSFELPKNITLDLAGSIAYQYSDGVGIVEYNDALEPTNSAFRNFQNGLVSVGLTIPFWKYFSAVPMIAYSFPLGNAADNMLSGYSKDIGLSGSASHFFGGVTLSMAF
ncbi:MAG TPA: hypothetical protein HPP90_09510 [Deltaproteobacteria bacterium]|nr:hypothetical protein [Deltaproteobacteria bacterium]